MMKRVLVWAGAVVALAALVGLGAYFATTGLDKADKLASVIGVFVALAGFGVTACGWVAYRRGGDHKQQTYTETPRDRSVGQGENGDTTVDQATNSRFRAKAMGHGRVYQAGRDQTINER